MKVIMMSALLTLSSTALSSSCWASNEHWEINSAQDSVSFVSTASVSAKQSGKLKVYLTRSTDNNSSCTISTSFTREQILESELEPLSRSSLSDCELRSSLGAKTYACHIQTVPSRSMQNFSLDIVTDEETFLIDALIFSSYLNVSVAKTRATESLELSYDLSGLRPLVSDIYNWCRDRIKVD